MGDVQQTVEILPKMPTVWVGCTTVTHRQTTDGRATAYSERERQFMFAKNDVCAVLQWSKRPCILACKRDLMVRDPDETETFDFQSETRSRPRPSQVSTRPRRDRDVWKLRLETVSRRRDRDYIPGNSLMLTGVCTYREAVTLLFRWEDTLYIADVVMLSYSINFIIWIPFSTDWNLCRLQALFV